ncbi:Anion exchange protein [Temnothorax longispinosus]|uniref:Anion exchange protein n=1 Tax=Temnothorax longispinosus TaxID=300112 RepID=A0A4V3S830_9HYME|nr:Anion exchange protein [Temnothorax longispinosus]
MLTLKRRRGWSDERGGVSSTWINTEERAGASTFCEKQYSRAADTRRTLSPPSILPCKGSRGLARGRRRSSFARRRSPSSSPGGRMRVICQPGKKDR